MDSSVTDGEAILQVRNLRKWFPLREGLLSRTRDSVKAVDGVSFDVYSGETLGIVGESGCGKSTTARCIPRLIRPDVGEMHFLDSNIMKAGRREMKRLRRDIADRLSRPIHLFEPAHDH